MSFTEIMETIICNFVTIFVFYVMAVTGAYLAILAIGFLHWEFIAPWAFFGMAFYRAMLLIVLIVVTIVHIVE